VADWIELLLVPILGALVALGIILIVKHVTRDLD
jgi:hypothetical protein